MAKKNMFVPLAILLIVILLSFLIVSGNTKKATTEKFEGNVLPDSLPMPTSTENPPDSSIAAKGDSSVNLNLAGDGGLGNLVASDPIGNESYNPVKSAPAAPVNSCFPRDRLTADDLLPKDAANSRWAQMNPAGQGDISDQNFLTAGYHVGINTTGSTKKNANLQLRSEPPNPQVIVSPWMQSTIEPSDVSNRRPLEIGGDY